MFKPVESESQIETVVNLSRVIWHEHYGPKIGSDQVSYMLDQYQSAQTIAHEMKEHNCRYYLIIEKKRPVGYLSVQPKNDMLILNNLYVLVSERGKGLGRKAIGHVLDIADQLALQKIRLRVNKASKRSISAYEKMGFVKTDNVLADIGGGYTIDDYEMEFTLPH